MNNNTTIKKFSVIEIDVKQKALKCNTCGQHDGVSLLASRLKPDKYILYCEHCNIAEYIDKDTKL